MRKVAYLSMSPDGRRVVAGITDTTAGGGKPHVWLLAPDTAPKQLTSGIGDKGEIDGSFSAGGSYVYFRAQQNLVTSIFRLPLAGGKPQELGLQRASTRTWTLRWGATSDDRVSVTGYGESSDGRYLAVWADDREAKAIRERKANKDDAYVHGRTATKTHLFIIDVVDDRVTEVTLPDVFRTATWSQLGTELYVTTGAEPLETGPHYRFWKVSPTTATLAEVELPPSTDTLSPSPDGSAIVYTDRCTDDAPKDCRDLFVRDVRQGTTRNLTRGLAGNATTSFFVTNDAIVTTIAQGFRTRIASVSAQTGAIAWHDIGEPVVSLLTTNRTRSGWAFVAESSTMPPTIRYTRRLADPSVALQAPVMAPRNWPVVPSRIIAWQNEGLTIEGALHLPPAAERSKVPLVVVIHGGPFDHFDDSYRPLAQLLVAQGWAVLLPNIRGSDGYGAAFAAAVKGEMGGADFRDVMAGVDTVVNEFPVDGDRMALIGYSYGGEMAAFAAGRTDRFKAIVSGGPVVDQLSEYGTEKEPYYDYWYTGHPWLNLASAWKQSPLSTAALTRTPLLLFHGEADSTDPLGQSLEMYRAVKLADGKVELIVYPREEHIPMGENYRAQVSEEPWHGVDLRRRMFGFIRAAFDGDADPLHAARDEAR